MKKARFYDHTIHVELPEWAHPLKEPYWFIRVEGRNLAKRRRMYRMVKKIRREIVESGVDQELVDMTCKYLASYRQSNAEKLQKLLSEESPQMRLF